uniref:Galectin n=1 Tax=Ailuropoda melanoleuca TaxID=9646 RepID=G1LTW9_AILME
MSGKFEMTNMDMKLGTTLKIKGKIASDADGFVINLGQGSEKLNLHFNPRFRDSVIVCNSREGRWGQEQRSEVKISVTFGKDEFEVKLPDGRQLTFPNRLGHSHISYLNVQGGLKVSSFKIDGE